MRCIKLPTISAEEPQYGGKIIAVARVVGKPEHLEDYEDDPHYWTSKIYAGISDICILDNPISIDESRSFIKISMQSAITPVIVEDFDHLRQIVLSKNHVVPQYLKSAKSARFPLSKVNNKNWLEVCYDNRRNFILEQQFRAYYVNFFLKVLGDRKTIYRECCVRKSGVTAHSYVDNVILFNGVYLPVEVKLNMRLEQDLLGQLSKYCNPDEVFLDQKMQNPIGKELLYPNRVLVIDVSHLCLYDDATGQLEELCNLDNIRTIDDILSIRASLMEKLLH